LLLDNSLFRKNIRIKA